MYTRYSAIWMARALPDDGQVTALELEPFNEQASTTTIIA
jgi:predicted O-methyltransferase YrrM